MNGLTLAGLNERQLLKPVLEAGNLRTSYSSAMRCYRHARARDMVMYGSLQVVVLATANGRGVGEVFHAEVPRFAFRPAPYLYA